MVPHRIKGKPQLGVNKFTGLVHILLKSIVFFFLETRRLFMKLPYCDFLHTVAMSLYHFHEYVFLV